MRACNEIIIDYYCEDEIMPQLEAFMGKSLILYLMTDAFSIARQTRWFQHTFSMKLLISPGN